MKGVGQWRDRQPRRVAVVVGLLAAVFATYLVASLLDLAERLHAWTRSAESVDLDELLLVPLLFALPFAVAHVRLVRRAERLERERRSAEAERARLATLPDQADAAIVELDVEGKVSYANGSARAMFPDLAAKGLGHPVFARSAPLFDAADPGGRIPVTREVNASGRVLEQRAWRVPEKGLIRVMMRDVTPRRNAEGALLRREAQLSEAEAIAHLGSWEWHVPHDRVYWSPELRRIVGAPARESPGTLRDLLAFVHADDRERVHGTLQQAARDGKPFAGIMRVAPEGAAVRTLRTAGRVQKDDQGRVVRVIGTALDVTESRRAERDLERQRGFVDLFRSIAVVSNQAPPGAEQAFRDVLRLVGEFMGWPIGHMHLVGTAGLEPTRLWHLADPSRYQRFVEVTESWPLRAGVGLPGRVLASGQPAWTTEASFDPRSPRTAVLRELGLRAGFAFPVRVGTETVGVLEFFAPVAAEPDPKLLEIMGPIGTAVGRVVERARAVETKSLYEALVKAQSDAGQAVAVSDGKRLRFANEALARMTGFSHEQLLALPSLLDLVTPEERPRIADRMERRRRGETVEAHYRTRLRRADGKAVDVEVLSQAVQLETGTLTVSVMRPVRDPR